MKRLPQRCLSTVFLLGALLGFTYAAQAADMPYSQGLLWKIEGGAARPSYLFGTMHSEDARVLNLPPVVQTAFDKSNIYVMEALLDENAMALMSSTMLFSDGRNLQQILSPASYAKTVAAMQAYGMPEAALPLLKPWAVAVTLAMPKPKTGVVLDLSLLQKAQAQAKQTAGLETVVEQLGALDNLPLSEQVTMLEDTLRQLPQLERLLAAMHNAYLARDLKTLSKISDEQIAQGDRALGKKLMNQLVTLRNQRMVERMLPYLKQGNAFIAIGALHLPGDQGVLKLLSERGFRLSAVY